MKLQAPPVKRLSKNEPDTRGAGVRVLRLDRAGILWRPGPVPRLFTTFWRGDPAHRLALDDNVPIIHVGLLTYPTPPNIFHLFSHPADRLRSYRTLASLPLF